LARVGRIRAKDEWVRADGGGAAVKVEVTAMVRHAWWSSARRSWGDRRRFMRLEQGCVLARDWAMAMSLMQAPQRERGRQSVHTG
jgi:hypothetical protein